MRCSLVLPPLYDDCFNALGALKAADGDSRGARGTLFPCTAAVDSPGYGLCEAKEKANQNRVGGESQAWEGNQVAAAGVRRPDAFMDCCGGCFGSGEDSHWSIDDFLSDGVALDESPKGVG